MRAEIYHESGSLLAYTAENGPTTTRYSILVFKCAFYYFIILENKLVDGDIGTCNNQLVFVCLSVYVFMLQKN